ncbi:MAG TPA: hypothetical protein PK777_06685, partial [Thermoguttaceae bacterium]|nr:hypothetical protein [Thermoguttaceae bacterium]
PWPTSSPSPSCLPFPSGDEAVGEYGFIIPLPDKGSGERIIEGYGTAGSETVTVEVEISLLPKVMTDGVFARDKISLDGSAWIKVPADEGSVNTNSTAPGSVFLNWSTSIDGNVNVGPDGDPNTVITGNGQVLGKKGPLPEPYDIPLPDFIRLLGA